MSLCLSDARVETKFESLCWLDDAQKAPRTSLVSGRKTWIKSIVFHTTLGLSGQVRSGIGQASTRGSKFAREDLANPNGDASWDFTVERDGTVVQHNDPTKLYSWHAERWNPHSIGIELEQMANGDLYADQLNVAVRLALLLTRHYGIQRQVHGVGGRPEVGKVISRASVKGPETLRGANMVGVFAHNHNTTNRGAGDPGPAIFSALVANGFEVFNFHTSEDIDVWKVRQEAISKETGQQLTIDGVPGPNTCKWMRRPHGLWVPHPDDPPVAGA